jgi:ankyrin repeat protein
MAVAANDFEVIRERFMAAVMEGNVRGCMEMADALGGPDAVVDFGCRTMLMVAGESESVEVCRALLDKGAGVNIEDDECQTALFLSVGSAEVCKLLIERGADINKSSIAEHISWRLPIVAAAGYGYVDTCMLIAGCGHAISEEVKRNALCASASAGRIEVLNALMKIWPLDAREALDEMLVHAAEEGALAMCKHLVARGARGSSPNAFMSALMGNHLQTAEYLLQAGVDIDAPALDGRPAMHHAVRGNMVSQLYWLLDRGADIHVESSFAGWTPLYAAIKACFSDDIEMVRALVMAGADTAPVCTEPGNLTPFQFAVKLGKQPLVRYFIEDLGEDIRQVTSGGEGLAELATDVATREYLEYLLSKETVDLIEAMLPAEQLSDRSPAARSRGMQIC